MAPPDPAGVVAGGSGVNGLARPLASYPGDLARPLARLSSLPKKTRIPRIIIAIVVVSYHELQSSRPVL